MNWIDGFISEIDAILDNYDRGKAVELVNRMHCKCKDEKVRIGFDMKTYRQVVVIENYTPFKPSDDDYISDLRSFRELLLKTKEERKDYLSVHYQPTMNVNVNVDISNCISIVQSFPESTLTDKDKNELSGMLATIQTLNGEMKKSKIMEVVKWLGDKAVDVAISVIPMLASMI